MVPADLLVELMRLLARMRPIRRELATPLALFHCFDIAANNFATCLPMGRANEPAALASINCGVFLETDLSVSSLLGALGPLASAS